MRLKSKPQPLPRKRSRSDADSDAESNPPNAAEDTDNVRGTTPGTSTDAAADYLPARNPQRTAAAANKRPCYADNDIDSFLEEGTNHQGCRQHHRCVLWCPACA